MENAPQLRPTDVMDLAQAHANPELHAQMQADAARQAEWLGNANEVERQTAQDVVNYLENRPYTDENGGLHAPNGEAAVHNDYDNDRTDAQYDASMPKAHAEKSLNELISDWAAAEKSDDKTTAGDVQDELLKRIDHKNLSDDHKVALIDILHNKKEAVKNGKNARAEAAADPFASAPSGEANNDLPTPTEMAFADWAEKAHYSDDDKQSVAIRAGLLKKWGISLDEVADSPQEIFEKLMNDDEWKSFQDRALAEGKIELKGDGPKPYDQDDDDEEDVPEMDKVPDLDDEEDVPEMDKVPDLDSEAAAEFPDTRAELRDVFRKKIEAADDSDLDQLYSKMRSVFLREELELNKSRTAKRSEEDILKGFQEYFDTQMVSMIINKETKLRLIGKEATPAQAEKLRRDIERQKMIELGSKYVTARNANAKAEMEARASATPETPERKRSWRRRAMAVGLGVLMAAGLSVGLAREAGESADATTAPAEATVPDTTAPETTTPDTTPETAPAAATFTVNEAWSPGAPTPWSWAESLGVKDVPAFLNEVMGGDWAEQARGMHVGDSVSATAEQIARYTAES